MNIFKRFYFSLEALFIVCFLFIVVSLLTIPSGLYFIAKGRYWGWVDKAAKRIFEFTDKRMEGLSNTLDK